MTDGHREHVAKNTQERSSLGDPEDRQDGSLDRDALRRREDSALLAEGFEPTEEGLWRKDGLWYGREAALQYVRRALHEDDDAFAGPDGAPNEA